MCIIFPITVRLLQNNERGFHLIFTIPVVELKIMFALASLLYNNHQGAEQLFEINKQRLLYFKQHFDTKEAIKRKKRTQTKIF
jgi:hypothetical protein